MATWGDARLATGSCSDETGIAAINWAKRMYGSPLSDKTRIKPHCRQWICIEWEEGVTVRVFISSSNSVCTSAT